MHHKIESLPYVMELKTFSQCPLALLSDRLGCKCNAYLFEFATYFRRSLNRLDMYYTLKYI